MGRREEWLRIGAVVVIVAILALLFLRDNSPEERTSTPDRSDVTPSDPVVVEPSQDPTDAETVPSPPAGLEDLVCQQFRQPLRLRLLSFNTHRSTGTVNAIAEEILEIDPDIVLLQEVDRKMLRTGSVDQAEVLADAVGMDGSFSSNLVRGSGQYGTLILSKYDVVQQGRIPLVRNPRSEARGLQWVTIDVDGRPVRVYNTHLDATRPAVRLAQAQQVADVLADDDLPVVLGGDLNAWPASAAVATIGRQLTDTWTTSGVGREDTSRGGRKIDYLFVRGLKPLVSQVAPSGASDHNRLWADVRLTAPDTCGEDSGKDSGEG
ncbi:Metal-dependent hydrolase, endonuclease/exonuclease/phosphatase family [Nocardioides exalbidus]|uniref:Metal-dependent hydrolase, endonuclease/exonuclease/phosphatase family n=1 Tax=Nocardioides exalbidus TaxID=402596 RepID=A0A1H4JFK3_9ACTN|nr:endonuclease/exonuclease/phosphatase family protein [Nocardioides exalbidus]SEB45073.1 Metal-dependent hydrolase, endonuclease/exonuclease/phosphatase family [Nocardioides exalbidus]